MFYEKIDYLVFYQLENVKEIQSIPFNINAPENGIKEIKMHWQMFIADTRIRHMKSKTNNVAYYFTSNVQSSDKKLVYAIVNSIILEFHAYRGIIILRYMTTDTTEIHMFVYPVHIATDTIKNLPPVVHVPIQNITNSYL